MTPPSQYAARESSIKAALRRLDPIPQSMYSRGRRYTPISFGFRCTEPKAMIGFRLWALGFGPERANRTGPHHSYSPSISSQVSAGWGTLGTLKGPDRAH